MQNSDLQDTLNRAFALIERGNELEKGEKFWEASSAFRQAKDLLQELADDTLPINDESSKISKLYQEKSEEYLVESRKAMIQAMSSEQKGDELRRANQQDFFLGTLSDEDAVNRVRLFMHLFAKEFVLKGFEFTEGGNDTEVVEKKQSSIEERLRDLNASIPRGLKSEDEQMRDISRGLKRLGLSTQHLDETSKLDLDVPPPSEEDQVSDILAQAKDEARFEPERDQQKGQGTIEEKEEDIELDSDLEDSDTDEDLLLLSDDEVADRIRKMRMVRKHVVRTQAKLAELVAWLDKESVVPEQGLEGGTPDDDDDDESVVEVDLSRGKKILSESKAILAQAMKKWSD